MFLQNVGKFKTLKSFKITWSWPKKVPTNIFEIILGYENPAILYTRLSIKGTQYADMALYI